MKVYVCDPKSLLKQLASHPGLLKVFLLWTIKLSTLQISTSSSTKMTWHYHKCRSYIQHYNKNDNKIQDSHSSWNISAFVDIDHPEDSLDVHFRNLSLKVTYCKKSLADCWWYVSVFVFRSLKWGVLKCSSVGGSRNAVHEQPFLGESSSTQPPPSRPSSSDGQARWSSLPPSSPSSPYS